MEKMRFKFCIFLYFLCFTFLPAQENAPVLEEEYDSLWSSYDYENNVESLLQKKPFTEHAVFPKKFSPNLNNKYKGEDFNYYEKKIKEPLIDRIKRRILKIIESVFGKLDPLKANKITETILRILAILAGGFVLYVLLRYLLGKDGNIFFSKRNKKLDISSAEISENIHEIDFPKSIAEFENRKDYRSAVRYHFLYFLKKLSAKNLIEWNPEKTNRDYYLELKDTGLKKNFRELSRVFEYVWYGEFTLNDLDYNYYRNLFQNIKI